MKPQNIPKLTCVKKGIISIPLTTTHANARIVQKRQHTYIG